MIDVSAHYEQNAGPSTATRRSSAGRERSRIRGEYTTVPAAHRAGTHSSAPLPASRGLGRFVVRARPAANPVENAVNIGIVCYASIGGSGIVATELGKMLASRGHHVHVLS